MSVLINAGYKASPWPSQVEVRRRISNAAGKLILTLSEGRRTLAHHRTHYLRPAPPSKALKSPCPNHSSSSSLSNNQNNQRSQKQRTEISLEESQTYLARVIYNSTYLALTTTLKKLVVEFVAFVITTLKKSVLVVEFVAFVITTLKKSVLLVGVVGLIAMLKKSVVLGAGPRSLSSGGVKRVGVGID